MEFKLDMSMMFAMHDALRRELGQVGRIAKLRDDDPAGLLRAALGWELFKKFLLVHHRSEDDALWPALRGRVAQQPGRVALVDALEAEHARIEPLLAGIDAAAADPADAGRRPGQVSAAAAQGLPGGVGAEVRRTGRLAGRRRVGRLRREERTQGEGYVT